MLDLPDSRRRELRRARLEVVDGRRAPQCPLDDIQPDRSLRADTYDDTVEIRHLGMQLLAGRPRERVDLLLEGCVNQRAMDGTLPRTDRVLRSLSCAGEERLDAYRLGQRTPPGERREPL